MSDVVQKQKNLTCRSGGITEALVFMDLITDSGRLVYQYSDGMGRRLEIAQSTTKESNEGIYDD